MKITTTPSRGTQPRIGRQTFAESLGVSPKLVAKLIDCSLIDRHLPADQAVSLIQRDWIDTISEPVAVLRTGPVWLDGPREVGYDLGHDDHTVLNANRMWWRDQDGDLRTVRLLLVTVATFVVAVLEITDTDNRESQEGWYLNEAKGTNVFERRHAYAARVLSRTTNLPRRQRTNQGAPEASLVGLRIKVTSGGPIGFF